MKIIFENKHGRKYEASDLENIHDIYEAIKDGLVAMSYHKNTAKDLVKELKEDEDN